MAISVSFISPQREQWKLFSEDFWTLERHSETYEIKGFYKNVDYWTLNSCLQQWLHLLLQSTLQSSFTPKSCGLPLILAAGFQTKKITLQ